MKKIDEKGNEDFFEEEYFDVGDNFQSVWHETASNRIKFVLIPNIALHVLSTLQRLKTLKTLNF